MLRVLRLSIDKEACTVCRACVDQCPELFEDDDGESIPVVRSNADRFFESHAVRILLAAEVCCVDAVKVEATDAEPCAATDPDRRGASPATQSLFGRRVALAQPVATGRHTLRSKLPDAEMRG
jgi:ferredoxin